jgi:hypothetical protein
MLYRTKNMLLLSTFNTHALLLSTFNTHNMGVGTILAERERERESIILYAHAPASM